MLAGELAGLPAGVKVATEEALVQRFGVGRATARTALQELERRYLVRRVQGVGTISVRRIDYVISPAVAPSWTRTVRAAGCVPRTVVLSCEPARLPDTAARRLDVSPDTDCFALRRRSFIDDLPASWGVEWVLADVSIHLPTAVRIEESLDHILRQDGAMEPARRWSRVSIEPAGPAAADGLQCRTGDPVWLIDSVIGDRRSGRSLMFTRRWIRADAIRVVVETPAHD